MDRNLEIGLKAQKLQVDFRLKMQTIALEDARDRRQTAFFLIRPFIAGSLLEKEQAAAKNAQYEREIIALLGGIEDLKYTQLENDGWEITLQFRGSAVIVRKDVTMKPHPVKGRAVDTFPSPSYSGSCDGQPFSREEAINEGIKYYSVVKGIVEAAKQFDGDVGSAT